MTRNILRYTIGFPLLAVASLFLLLVAAISYCCFRGDTHLDLLHDIGEMWRMA